MILDTNYSVKILQRISSVDTVDAMVAAVADPAGETVVTNNVTDFRQLGVGVESF